MGVGILWWIGPISNGIAAWQFAESGIKSWAWVAAGVAALGLWTAGIGSNFALTSTDDEIPTLVVYVNLPPALGGVGMLIGAIAGG